MSVKPNVSNKHNLDAYNLMLDISEKPSRFRGLIVSMFWVEKLLIFLEGLQIYGLVYAANYEEWPNSWKNIVNKSCVSVLAGDFATLFREDFFDDHEKLSAYTGVYIFIVAVLLSAYFAATVLLYRSAGWKLSLQMISYRLGHILYLPVALGVLPNSWCAEEDCWSTLSTQVVIFITSVFVFAIYLLGLPIFSILHAGSHQVSNYSEDHEEWVRVKELEYVLQISPTWLVDRYYIFSSYRRTYFRVYHKGLYQIFVLALVLVHTFFGDQNDIKMLVFSLMLLCMALYCTVKPVYRCLSSSFLYMIIWWTLTANAFQGYMKAADYGGDELVDSNMTSILGAINLTSLVIFIFLMFVYVLFKLKWPVNMDSVKQLAMSYRYLLVDLRNAQKMILKLRVMPSFQFVHEDALKEMMRLLREHYMLLYSENHPLQYTVLEQLDSLEFLRKQVAYQTLLPNKKLEANFETFVKVIQRRWREQILMTPLKRRILLKLLTLGMFLGNRKARPFNVGSTFNFINAGDYKKEISLTDFDSSFLKGKHSYNMTMGRDKDFNLEGNSDNILLSPVNHDYGTDRSEDSSEDSDFE
jgi:hypothetical protein